MIYRVLDLLSTIEEAFLHMQLQLEELRLEESLLLFQDASFAIERIAHHTNQLMSKSEDLYLYKMFFREMRESITKLIDAYEENNLFSILTALDNSLIPAFTNWRLELERLLRPSLLN